MKRQLKKKKIKKNIFKSGLCPNCGEKGPHFIPPGFGSKGVFTCKEKVV